MPQETFNFLIATVGLVVAVLSLGVAIFALLYIARLKSQITSTQLPPREEPQVATELSNHFPVATNEEACASQDQYQVLTPAKARDMVHNLIAQSQVPEMSIYEAALAKVTTLRNHRAPGAFSYDGQDYYGVLPEDRIHELLPGFRIRSDLTLSLVGAKGKPHLIQFSSLESGLQQVARFEPVSERFIQEIQNYELDWNYRALVEVCIKASTIESVIKDGDITLIKDTYGHYCPLIREFEGLNWVDSGWKGPFIVLGREHPDRGDTTAVMGLIPNPVTRYSALKVLGDYLTHFKARRITSTDQDDYYNPEIAWLESLTSFEHVPGRPHEDLYHV